MGPHPTITPSSWLGLRCRSGVVQCDLLHYIMCSAQFCQNVPPQRKRTQDVWSHRTGDFVCVIEKNPGFGEAKHICTGAVLILVCAQKPHSQPVVWAGLWKAGRVQAYPCMKLFQVAIYQSVLKVWFCSYIATNEITFSFTVTLQIHLGKYTNRPKN